jgi:uncharacterized protein (TIGR00369 family)
MEARNPKWREYTQFKMDKNKFMKHIGFEFTDILPGKTVGKLVFQEFHEQQNGYLHGGMTSTILDMVCGFAAYTLVEQDQQVFTVESKVNYYNRGMGKEYFAEGRVDKAGKRFHFCEGEIFYFEGDKKITVAKCTTTMAVL